VAPTPCNVNISGSGPGTRRWPLRRRWTSRDRRHPTARRVQRARRDGRARTVAPPRGAVRALPDPASPTGADWGAGCGRMRSANAPRVPPAAAAPAPLSLTVAVAGVRRQPQDKPGAPQPAPQMRQQGKPAAQAETAGTTPRRRLRQQGQPAAQARPQVSRRNSRSSGGRPPDNRKGERDRDR